MGFHRLLVQAWLYTLVHRLYTKVVFEPRSRFPSLLRFSLDEAMTPLSIGVQDAKEPFSQDYWVYEFA